MKMIIAFVRPESLNAVKAELYSRQIFNMSVTNVLGSGRQKGFTETYRGVVMEVNLLKKVRLEIGVNDTFVDAAVEAIMKGAYTGKEGDGVIFVQEILKSYRVRTREEGSTAIG
ncbi:MAG: P-II family nitrogen regulator [Deltaproteobacteria bacterium]|nr:P-II family nitrogen regulator [Deltaproteobacteria bacterium]